VHLHDAYQQRQVDKHIENSMNIWVGFSIRFDPVDTAISVCNDLQSCLLPSSNALLLWSTPQADQGVDSKSFVELLGTGLTGSGACNLYWLRIHWVF